MSNDMNDEFGDDSLFIDMDVDQMVAQQQQEKRCRESAMWSEAAVGGNDEDDDDEFGDASFLEHVDVDQMVAQHEEQQKQQQRTSKNNENVLPNNNNKNQPTQLHNEEVQDASIPSKRVKYEPSVEQRQLFRQCLHRYFGYSDFRPGQLDVIEAVVTHRRDAAVFWATGQGKSLCYQIPALLRPHDQVVLCVSPLISLMQDQVHKLNGLMSSNDSSKPLATFLGSGQADPTVEARALQGDFALVYVTPEKLVSGTFLQSLARLHATIKPIALIAVDEAHCVSEWGHDFRPEFRAIGAALRDQGTSLASIPIVALTATAVPRVQADIGDSLRLRPDALQSVQSLDRSNLQIAVAKKPPHGGVAAALQPLLAQLRGDNDTDPKKRVRPSQQSTIVYAPTRAAVEEVGAFLQKNLPHDSEIVVETYHAGMPVHDRHAIHTNFLTGRTHVICSTVAFGMGIDKPDTRRVVHYGPPQTVEEYYQQIGRAGRDGLPAECFMVVSETDFDRYQSDFYLGKLDVDGPALQATKASMAALRSYALDAQQCRRKALLTYFEQLPAPFGDRCGTCDNCRKRAQYGSDLERDFGPLGARLVLQAVGALKSQGLTQLVKVLEGKLVDDYRYAQPSRKQALQRQAENAQQQIPSYYPTKEYFRELLSSLVAQGYVSESTKSTLQAGYHRSWTVYTLSPKGLQHEHAATPIELPVPDAVRQAERKQEEQRQKMLSRLEASGIPREKLPVDEVEQGDGEVVRAYSKWFQYVDTTRQRSEDRVSHLEALLTAIEAWRSRVAYQHRMPPGSVLAEHTMASLAYAQATLPPGQKMDAASLTGAGVRSKELPSLVATLGKWVDEVQPARPASSSEGGKDPKMVFPTGFVQGNKWEHALYRPNKKTGVAIWEASYDRFVQGESPQTIAMTPGGSRKPIQALTVVGHLLEAMVHGRKVAVASLVQFAPPPTASEWQRFQEAEAMTGMNVTGNPDTSGVNGDKFLLTDLVKPIVGDAIAEKPFADRTEEEKQVFSYWCDRLKWYLALRRIDHTPTFS